jgi:hypothetical protein
MKMNEIVHHSAKIETAPAPLTVDELAGILYEAIKRQPNVLVCGAPERGRKTLIDGDVYLRSVARTVLAALAGKSLKKTSALEASAAGH